MILSFILPSSDSVTALALWRFLPLPLLLTALSLPVSQCYVPPSPQMAGGLRSR